MQTETFFTIPELCKILKIGKTSVYKLLNKGDIEAKKIGNKTLIPRDEVIHYLGSLRSYPVKCREI